MSQECGNSGQLGLADQLLPLLGAQTLLDAVPVLEAADAALCEFDQTPAEDQLRTDIDAALRLVHREIRRREAEAAISAGRQVMETLAGLGPWSTARRQP